MKIDAFSDADWGCCTESRKSLMGYCVFLGSCLISWKTKKQTIVARSSTEAKYRVLAATVSKLLWITYILRDFKIEVPQPISLYCDNLSTIRMVENPVHHERTKHVDIDCHFVRDHYSKGFFIPIHIMSKNQVANLLTKPLAPVVLNHIMIKLNMSSLHAQLEGMVLKDDHPHDQLTYTKLKDEAKLVICVAEVWRMHGIHAHAKTLHAKLAMQSEYDKDITLKLHGRYNAAAGWYNATEVRTDWKCMTLMVEKRLSL